MSYCQLLSCGFFCVPEVRIDLFFCGYIKAYTQYMYSGDGGGYASESWDAMIKFMGCTWRRHLKWSIS